MFVSTSRLADVIGVYGKVLLKSYRDKLFWEKLRS